MRRPLLTALLVTVLLVVLVSWFYMRHLRSEVISSPVVAPEKALVPISEPLPKAVVETPPVEEAMEEEQPLIEEQVKVLPLQEPAMEPPAEIPTQSPPIEITAAAEGPQIVELLPDQALAVVNDKIITLKDLVPIPEPREGLPKKMEMPEFRVRLQKAIETEVILQAAAARGVTLTPEQQQSVRSLRDRKMADIETYRQQGLMWAPIMEEQIRFAERQAMATMLLQNMLAPGKGPTPLTEEEVSQYYETNPGKFGALPEDPAAREMAWQQIRAQVVQALISERPAQVEQAKQELIEQLKKDARIQITFTEGGGAMGP